jgi:ribosome recycling factor
MFDDIHLETEARMDKALEHLTHSFRGIRTGRASTGLVEEIRVDYYGSVSPLKHMASISVPEPRLILIKPFDGGTVNDVMKALQKSELGITPQSDGKLIRLAVPPLSEERRKKLSHLVKDKAEEARVSLRNVRRDSNKAAESAQKDGDLSEDDLGRLKDEIDKLTKEFEGKVGAALDSKVKEVMEI